MGFFDGAGGGFIGGLFQGTIGNAQNRANAAEANDWANEAARVNRQWQERMSNTAHQREVADLKAAGLNPILSGTGGAGAAAGGGATADTANIDSTDYQFVSTAMEAARMKQELKVMKAQEEQMASAAELNRSSRNKVDKEADILGPKSYIYDKFKEALETVPKKIDGWKKEMKMSDPKVESQIWRKP